MKKVLIITSRSEKTVSWAEREKFVADFCNRVSSKLDEIKLIFTTYNDLVYTVVDGKAKIFDKKNKLDLTKVSLVHFKNWSHNTAEAPVVAGYLKANNIAFYNSEVGVPIPPGKLAQMFILANNELPVPDTLFSARLTLKEVLSSDMPEGFKYPLIIKANDGSKGNDNYLANDQKEAIKILDEAEADKLFIVQNFVPNNGDYRYLFVGLYSKPLVIHRQSNYDNHLNNTSKGAHAKFLDLGDLPKEYLQYARKAAELLGREIGGVDILVDEQTKKAYVLEVNGTPALATGFGVDAKEDYFADFIEGLVGDLEDESEE